MIGFSRQAATLLLSLFLVGIGELETTLIIKMSGGGRHLAGADGITGKQWLQPPCSEVWKGISWEAPSMFPRNFFSYLKHVAGIKIVPKNVYVPISRASIYIQSHCKGPGRWLVSEMHAMPAWGLQLGFSEPVKARHGRAYPSFQHSFGEMETKTEMPQKPSG